MTGYSSEPTARALRASSKQGLLNTDGADEADSRVFPFMPYPCSSAQSAWSVFKIWH